MRMAVVFFKPFYERALFALVNRLEDLSSTLLHQRRSPLADFLKRHFKPTKLLRAQFREHFTHLP
jgi:hypothetical protein